MLLLLLLMAISFGVFHISLLSYVASTLFSSSFVLFARFVVAFALWPYLLTCFFTMFYFGKLYHLFCPLITVAEEVLRLRP